MPPLDASLLPEASQPPLSPVPHVEGPRLPVEEGRLEEGVELQVPPSPIPHIQSPSPRPPFPHVEGPRLPACSHRRSSHSSRRVELSPVPHVEGPRPPACPHRRSSRCVAPARPGAFLQHDRCAGFAGRCFSEQWGLVDDAGQGRSTHGRLNQKPAKGREGTLQRDLMERFLRARGHVPIPGMGPYPGWAHTQGERCTRAAEVVAGVSFL